MNLFEKLFELIPLLLGFLFILGLIAVVGHGIWIFVASILRALRGPRPAAPVEGRHPPDRPEACPGCGRLVEPSRQRCICGLVLSSSDAAELRDLQATSRQLSSLLRAGTLEQKTFERVQDSIVARRRNLMGRPVPAAQPAVQPADEPVRPVPSQVEEPALPLWQRLEQILEVCQDVRDLAVAERDKALAWYRQLTAERVEAMSVRAQAALARLLRLTGQTGEAIGAYWRLLHRYPDAPGSAEMAYEAGRLAADNQAADQACWFLRQALAKPLPAGSRRQAEQLLERLQAPAEEEIPEVLPVSEAVAVSAVTREPQSASALRPASAAAHPPSSSAVGRLSEPSYSAPRRSLTEVLAAFMEERNIFWGELVGGLLMVGCSIALVIYLWKDLERIHYFPFLIFASTTALLFGAGLYAWHRLKLQTTGRGLLLIATLLVPLNFLVMAGLAGQETGANRSLTIYRISAETIALALFAWLMSLSARALVPEGRWPILLGVLGASASLLAVRFLDHEQTALWPFLGIACLPVASHAASAGGLLYRLGRRRPLEVPHANALFSFLGLATFSLVVALGFLVYWTLDRNLALERLSLPLAVAGIPILAAGLLVHHGLEPEAPARDNAAHRTAGTAVALAGMLVMLAAVLLAWPQPVALILVCAVDCTVLMGIAFRYRLPVAHAAALSCLAIGYITAYHLLAGHLDAQGETGRHLLEIIFSSGSALLPLVLLFGIAAEVLARSGRQPHAVYYAVGSGLVALVSLALVNLKAGSEPQSAAVVTGIYAAASLAMNLRWRRPEVTWLGSALILVTLRHALVWGQARYPWTAALLGHASVALTASLLAQLKSEERRTFIDPLSKSALISSCIALPVMLLAAWGEMVPLAGLMGWLSALWLVIAWSERRPGLFAAFQAALITTVLLAVTAWLQGQAWVLDHYPDALADPRSLQAYGTAVGLLGVLWIALRLSLRSNAVAQKLLEPAWPAVDWVVLGLLVLFQFGLAVWGVVPGAVRELTPAGIEPAIGTWPAEYYHAYGPGAWLLLGVLAVALVAALWERRQAEVVLGLIILAVTVPVLVAGRFNEELASASALRWGLAIVFLVCSLPLWLRDRVFQLATRLRCAGTPALSLPQQVRGLLIAGSVLPVLGLTTAVALVGFSGRTPSGPLPGSFFHQIGWIASNVLPLVLVSLGLVGHALRERSAGYAFSAGLVAEAAVMGGYALGIVTAGQHFGGPELVTLLQLGTITAALWALAWLASRPWTDAWRERPDSPLAGPLMTVQLALSVAGNAWLLLVAVCALVIRVPPAQAPWTIEAGSLLGWLAWLLAAAAGAWCMAERGTRLHAYTPGLIGLAGLALLPCTIAGWQPAWGYRALMLGWAAYAPAFVLAGWLSQSATAWESASAEDAPGSGALELLRSCARVLARSRAFMPPATAFWVRVAGILVVLLGLKAAIVHEDHLWAAGAIALAGTAGAAMAVWRRREDWAFAAGLTVNLAASLFVWHIHVQDPAANWWVYLLQANVIASGTVALLWLGARRQLYGSLELSLGAGPLLATQIVLGLCGNAVLLLAPFGHLFFWPGEALPDHLLATGSPWGWLALLLAIAAAFGYAGQVAPHARAHVLGAFGLGLGILAACSVSRWDDQGQWLAYHLLNGAWTGTGLVILAAEILPRVKSDELEEFSSLPSLARFLAVTPAQLRGWLNGVGLLVLGLAWRGTWEDPARPYWSAGAALAVSVMAGAVALRSRQPIYTYISGLLINVAGSIAWVAWALPPEQGGLPHPYSFGYTHVLCFAIASVIWSLLELALLPTSRPQAGSGTDLKSVLHDRARPFRHVGAICALSLLVILVASGLISDLAGGSLKGEGLLPWIGLGAAALSLAVCLWDGQANFTLAGFYALGLVTVGLTLHALEFEPRDLGWTAAPALAGYVLLTTAFASLTFRARELWQALRLPARALSWPEGWFAPTQTVMACGVIALSVWISQSFETPWHCLVGPLSLVPLVLAGVLLAASQAGRWASDLRYSTLAVGVLLLAEAGWAFLDQASPSIWMYRSIVLMVALALMTLVYGVGFARVLPWLSAWAECSRRIGPVLGSLGAAVLLAVLAQERFLYDIYLGRTSMAWPAITVVAVALLGLIAAGIYFAVVPGRDPFGLSDRGRTLYVYAGEILLVLMFDHFRLTVPELFRLGIFVRYWPFIIMAIAFAGVGLSEFFSRRGLPVLAEPLQRTGVFLPLLPLLAFWILRRDAGPFDKYALEWFLAAGLYTLLALTKRSFRFALFASLAGNAGLWALLYHNRLGFVTHPQMWLIPFALIVLVAEHLNRDRLLEHQSNTLRYLALLVIYVSSTADMFIAGLGTSVVWPLVLALLSLTGFLAGILLHVRAFLYLGVTFLFVVVFSMIWHAAVGQGQIWIWWVSGIVLGLGIFVLFAIFENRRNDVLRMIEQIKKWD